LNLPDNLGAKKKDTSSGGGYSLNNDIINDMNKKNQLNRINIKFGAAQQAAQKPAEELHEMKLVVPSGSQRDMNDEEINDLLNGAGDMVQPHWNVSGLRETQFVPTSTASGFDDDDDDNSGFRVYDNRRRGQDKMKTIKEEVDEERKSDGGSDDEGYFDNSDQKNQDKKYSEEEFRKLRARLYDNHPEDEDEDHQVYEDEDNKPYDDDEEEIITNPQDEDKRLHDEFGNGSDEDEEETSAASEVSTLHLSL
jgi:hypothetical protein